MTISTNPWNYPQSSAKPGPPHAAKSPTARWPLDPCHQLSLPHSWKERTSKQDLNPQKSTAGTLPLTKPSLEATKPRRRPPGGSAAPRPDGLSQGRGWGWGRGLVLRWWRQQEKQKSTSFSLVKPRLCRSEAAPERKEPFKLTKHLPLLCTCTHTRGKVSVREVTMRHAEIYVHGRISVGK